MKTYKKNYRRIISREYIESRTFRSNWLRGHMVLLTLECGHVEERQDCSSKKSRKVDCWTCSKPAAAGRLTQPGLKRYHYVPIYNVNLTLYVTDDTTRTFNRLAPHYKLEPETGTSDAICQSDSSGNFFLLLRRDAVTEDAIAHEIKHCADRIMEFIGQQHCHKCNNEPHAYLTGYLQSWVKKQLRLGKVRVR